jgi:DUF1016 N-terminal domain
MRAFAHAWPADENGGAIGQRPVAQLSWGQNISLLTKLKEHEARLWYAHKAIEHGWSRPVLEAQIATRLREREGNAISSFAHALPPADSELVRDAIKDPYNFEFLGVGSDARERDLERALLRDTAAPSTRGRRAPAPPSAVSCCAAPSPVAVIYGLRIFRS